MAESSGVAPQGPRRHPAMIPTLMPHLAAERHHVYRDATALALLAALVAAAVGSLPVALVLTAVALPAAVLVYIHDHRLWHDEPITLIALAFGLSLLLGVGVGALETRFIKLMTTGASGYYLPPTERILDVGLLVPVAAFVAVLIAPLLVSARPAFRHPLDVVVAGSLSGAAMSLGLSIVVQHGAFSHIQATSGDPAHVAFIALTLGFLQPIVLATAATVAVLGLRRLGVSPMAGLLKGLALVMAYELATTLLQPYGTRGIVLTAVAAFLLAGAGLAVARNGLHAAVVADADAHVRASHTEHRLHAGLVAGIVAVVVVIAAMVSVAVVIGGPATRPAPPGEGGGPRLSPHNGSAVGSVHPLPDEKSWGRVALASSSSSLAVGAQTVVHLVGNVALTVTPGWVVTQQGGQSATLFNSDRSAGVFADAGRANTPDVRQESTALINQNIRSNGLTNVQETPTAPITIQGNTFQDEMEVDYTADVQTDQGTMQVWGAWVTMYSASNGLSGLFNLFANSKAVFGATCEDIRSMLVSMR